MPSYKGDYFFKGDVAYVEQEPYIFSGSVRDNIVLGKTFDTEWYN